MQQRLRRIVTGNNDQGQSQVEIDGGPATAIEAGGSGLYEIWQSTAPADTSTLVDSLAGAEPRLCPDPGQVKVRWFTVPPDDDVVPLEVKAAATAAAFAAVGASHVQVDTSRHHFMHKTESLDYIVLISGEIDMLLDNGEVRGLKPGDVVVQHATNHAWVNRGSETALLVSVLIDAGT